MYNIQTKLPNAILQFFFLFFFRWASGFPILGGSRPMSGNMEREIGENIMRLLVER